MNTVNLDQIPSGSLCVLDTKVLIYAEQGFSPQSQRLLRRIETQEISGVLPQPVWEETIQRLMILEAMMQGHVRGVNPSLQLASMPEVVKGLTIYRQKIKALITLGFRYEPCREVDLLDTSLAMQEQHGLLPGDSLILAMAMRIGADFLASANTRYNETGRIAVASPTDVVLGSSS